MKNTKVNKTQKNIYTLSGIAMVVLLSFSYIICIYKTVVLASDSEINNKNVALLSAEINQKEFEYISQVSDIDLNKAIDLGYVKNSEDIIAYFDINDNSEFAIR
jgi:hypothetical protein